MKRYDTIEVVEKNVVEVTEVEKFNPFHDSRGRFSNKNGFKSYSANPNTKAGAMAIARSAAAGHGNTQNVHSQSYGENIRQNANWLGRGKQVKPGQQGNATLRQRVEPITGLSGASAVGSSWQYQNQQQGRTTQPGKQPQQKPQQAATAAPKQQATQTQAQNQNATQKPQQKPQKPANDRQPVDGEDLVAKLGAAKVKNMSIDEIIEMQGFNKKPQIAQTEAEFEAAVKKSGNVGVRSWNASGPNAAQTMAAYDDQLKNGDFYTKCSGGNALGRGMYVAVSSKADRGLVGGVQKGDIDYGSAYSASSPYGSWHVNMVIDSSAKLISYRDAVTMARKDGFKSGGWSSRDSVNDDIGAYVAAKGYDGIIMSGRTGSIAQNKNCRGEYVNMVNRSKVTIFDVSGQHSSGNLTITTSMTTNRRGTTVIKT